MKANPTRTFWSPVPSANIYFQSQPGTTIQLEYSMKVSVPDVSMLVNQLSTSNPLWLQGGNPDMKQRFVHQFSLNGSKMLKNSQSVFLNASVSLIKNDFVQRSRFFTEETYLPEYNYEADEGATLVTYANGKRSVNVFAKGSYSGRIQPLKSVMTLSYQYSYGNPQEYVGEQLLRQHENRSTVEVSLRSNFSLPLSLTVESATTYCNYRSSLDRVTEVVSEKVKGTL